MRLSIERLALALGGGTCIGIVVAPALVTLFDALGTAAAILIGAGVALLVHLRLPHTLDGTARHRPRLTAACALVLVLTITQAARLGAHMEDPASEWWVSTKQELWSKHACETAYIYAADLVRQGETNVYDGTHYPGLNREATPHPTVANLAVEDPYQYPPPFLMLPRIAIALGNDYLDIRAVWYSLNVLLFVGAALALARWLGGRAGAIATGLIPVVWLSTPSLLNFQYGQFHVATIALAIGAFVAFETRRTGTGGALLAGAILAKGFPAIVLVPMLLQRRWRQVASTGAWAIGLTVLAWGIIGTEPFRAFVTYQIEHVASGAAFAFDETWPEVKAQLLAGNISAFSAVRKLGELGVAGATDTLARIVHGLFTLSFVAFAVLAARVRAPRSRAVVWLALLNLAAMASPAAWGDYVPVGTLWLLTLMVTGTERLRPAALAAAGTFAFFVPGVVPIGNIPGPELSMAISVAATLFFVGVNGWVTWRAAQVPVVAWSTGALTAEVARG